MGSREGAHTERLAGTGRRVGLQLSGREPREGMPVPRPRGRGMPGVSEHHQESGEQGRKGGRRRQEALRGRAGAQGGLWAGSGAGLQYMQARSR